MYKEDTLSSQVHLPEQWPTVRGGVQLMAGKVSDEDKLVREFITLGSVGKVIHGLQEEEEREPLHM